MRKNIVLTGYMASGKTTIGKLICQKLSMKFRDTDEIIEKQENMKISEIFERYGEEYFRKLENDVSKQFKNTKNFLIATGGGFVLNPSNIENLRKNSVIINLKTSPEIIKARIQEAKKTRPLMSDADLSEVLERFNKREPFYANNDICIELSPKKTAEEHSEIVISEYKKYLKESGD